MSIKTVFTTVDIKTMLSGYLLGDLIRSTPITEGTVQTSYLIETQTGKYVLRYYENRSFEQVMFEQHLIDYLVQNGFSCARIIHSSDKIPGIFRDKPFLIFDHMSGESIASPNQQQRHNLIKVIATLSNLTRSLQLPYTASRLNYQPADVIHLADDIAAKSNDERAGQKKTWLLNELDRLELPETLSIGICHCDFHYSNILYCGDRINALLDFDDANQTYLYFDIISVIDFFRAGFNHETWHQFGHSESILEFSQARDVLSVFQTICPIPRQDKEHFYDVLKLGILIDSLWYFNRWHGHDFFERRKIEAINQLGRVEFTRQLDTI